MKNLLAALLIVLVFSFTAHAVSGIYRPDKSNDEVLQNLINEKGSKFSIKTYSDDITGLSIKYNIYLPDDYSSEKKYPVVFFIPDASSVGKEPEFAIKQGYGALVWPDDCIVISPVFPEVVIDDHNGFKLSRYYDLILRFVNASKENYSIDETRIYATGQSMGCMIFLLLSSQNPEIFTACLFVSGQWDITQLDELPSIPFIYAASLGDDKASKGQSEVINMFDEKKLSYVHYNNINAKYPDITLIPDSQLHNFITFSKSSTLPDNIDSENYSEHMTSFDYAYKNESIRNWLLSQTKTRRFTK